MRRTSVSLVAACGVIWPTATALAWDAPYAIRPDAEVTPRLDVGARATMPATEDPTRLNAYGFVVSAGVSYLDDDKVVRLEVVGARTSSTFREARSRYEPSGEASFSDIDQRAQLRVLPRFHLHYGAALLRGPGVTHAYNAGLSLHLGMALPLLGEREAMGPYHRAHLQIETRPIVVSLAAVLDQEGLRNIEGVHVQVAGETALTGRVETEGGVVEGGILFSGSYLHQHSVYVVGNARYRTPDFWGFFAPVLDVSYVWPAQPMRMNHSEEAERLVNNPHLTVQAGISFVLEMPSSTPLPATRRQEESDSRAEAEAAQASALGDALASAGMW